MQIGQAPLCSGPSFFTSPTLRLPIHTYPSGLQGGLHAHPQALALQPGPQMTIQGLSPLKYPQLVTAEVRAHIPPHPQENRGH